MLKNVKKVLTICFDMDDTIEDLMHPWIATLNRKYGLNVQYEDVTSWEMKYAFPTLTEHQIFEPLWCPEFWDEVKPKHNSPYWIKKIIDDGHKVYICTNTHYKIAAYKMDKALFKYFPYLGNSNLIMMRDKQMIQCDYLVDDGIHNIVGSYKGLLMDMPHNQNFTADSVTRVHNFEEVYNIISAAANA